MTAPKVPNTKTPAKKGINPILIIFVVVAIALLWKVMHKDGNNSDVATTTTTQIPVSAAQKLASLDANSTEPLSPADEQVVAVDKLLNSLSASYKEPPEMIGNATYVACQALKRKGINESHYNILLHMSKQEPAPGTRYKQSVMQYVATRTE